MTNGETEVALLIWILEMFSSMRKASRLGILKHWLGRGPWWRKDRSWIRESLGWN